MSILYIVQATTSIDSKPLSSIDVKLEKTGDFLHILQSNPKLLESLRVFTQCTNIVDWIRGDTKGYTIIHVQLRLRDRWNK